MIVDLDSKIPCHMAGSMSGFFDMIDISPDYGPLIESQGKTYIMQVSYNDLD
jgi:hypothetical protein